jgi:hypothetical protein
MQFVFPQDFASGVEQKNSFARRGRKEVRAVLRPAALENSGKIADQIMPREYSALFMCRTI